MKKEEEKREYFRVKDEIFLHFREIDEAEFQRLYEERRNQEEVVFQEGKVGAHKREPADRFSLILDYLISIDRKISAILALLEKTSEKDGYVEGARTIDISASGIRFVSPAKPEKRFMELVLDIPLAFGKSIKVLAEVVRVKPYEPDQTLWEIAARYRDMGEKERDALISYLLKREREHLSSTRMDE